MLAPIFGQPSFADASVGIAGEEACSAVGVTSGSSTPVRSCASTSRAKVPTEAPSFGLGPILRQGLGRSETDNLLILPGGADCETY